MSARDKNLALCRALLHYACTLHEIKKWNLRTAQTYCCSQLKIIILEIDKRKCLIIIWSSDIGSHDKNTQGLNFKLKSKHMLRT